MENVFSNPSAISFKDWLFLKTDKLPALAFYFLSKKNSTSPRFFPLFNEMKNLRIVVVKGTRFRYFDRIQIKLLRILVSITYPKTKSYNWVFDVGYLLDKKPLTNQVLNLDDPEYSLAELNRIKAWEQKVINCNFKNVIIVTSEYTKSYLSKSGVKSEIFVIYQGYSKNNDLTPGKFRNFSIVYASPYIYSSNDKKFRVNSHWSVDLFISKIIPKIIEMDSNIDLYLIGRMGESSKDFLNKFSNVKLMGLLPINETSQVLAKCHVGLYPRTYDTYRQSQKITEYIGANLPIVTFSLTDSDLVQKLDIGICVDIGAVNKFAEAIISLKKSKKKVEEYESRICSIKNDFSWSHLGARFDEIISNKDKNLRK